MEPVGSLELKGVAAPVDTYRYRPIESHRQPALALPVTADLALVGRDDAMRALQDAWRRTCEGGVESIYVTGEPGAGKSRLVAEFLRSRPDATALIGRCDERVGSAFYPFAEVLRDFVSKFSDEHAAIAAAVLARIAPSVAGSQPSLSSGPAADRQELFTDVAEWLAQACQVRPMVIVIDDLHWADEPTVLLLRHLLGTRPNKLMLIATYRDTDVSGTALSAVLADLRRLPSCSTIELSGLDAEHVEMLAREAGVDGDPRVLAERTGGNPLFVTELLLHPSEGAVPVTIASLLAQRLDRLPASTSAVLGAAAVAGPVFFPTLIEVALAAESSADEVLDALDGAAQAGLLIEEADGNYRFTHALIRESLLDRVGGSRVRRLHLVLADALVSIGGPAVDVASHFRRARDPRRSSDVVTWSRRAAADAFAALAFESAIAILEDAIDVVSAEDPSRARLVLDLGEIRRRLRDPERAIPLLKEAAELAKRFNDAETLAGAAIGLSGWYYGGDLDSSAGALLLRSAHDMLSPDDSPLLARVLAARALVAEGEQVQMLADEARAMAARLSDPAVSGFVAQSVLMTNWDKLPANFEAYAQESAAMRRACKISGVPELEGTAPLLGIHAHNMCGDLDGAGLIAREMIEAGERRRLSSSVAHGHLTSGMLALAEGRADEADQQWNLAIAKVGDDRFGQSQALSQLFWLRRHQGRLAELEPMLAGEILPSQDIPSWAGAIDAHIGLGLADLGREEAEPRVIAVAQSLEPSAMWFWATWITGVASAEAGLPDAAALVLPLLNPWSGFSAYSVNAVWYGPIDSLIGELHRTLGDAERALMYQERALEQLGARELPTVRARIYLAIANARRASGDNSGARHAAAVGAELAATASMPVVQERCASLAFS